jgi:hypothetical protein
VAVYLKGLTMLLTIVAWVVFVLTSLSIAWAVIDTFYQFGISQRQRILGVRRHYMTDRMFIIVIFCSVSAWIIFG